MVRQLQKVVDRALDGLVEAIKAGKSDQLQAYLKLMGQFYRYSLGNSVLIKAQKPCATKVMGFRGWNRLGRRVKKGERGIRILAPVLKPTTITLEDDEEITEEEVVGYRLAYVFDVTQTRGKPLPQLKRYGSIGGIEVYLQRISQFCEQRGIQLSYGILAHGIEGVSSGGSILVSQKLSGMQLLSTTVHEIAHELLHQHAGNLLKKAQCETEAEAVAYAVCEGVKFFLEVDRDEAHVSSDYIQLWGGDEKALMQSLQRIKQVSATLLRPILESDHWR